MLYLVLSLLGLSAAAFYVYIVWNNDYWKKKNVPHEKPAFFFGNFKSAFSGEKHFGLIYHDIYKKHPSSPYVGVFKLRHPAILIKDLDLIKNVLVRDFASFASNDVDVNESADPIVVENIFLQSGEKWKKNRAAWTAALTMNKIKVTHEIASEKCDRMIEYIESHQNTPIEARLLSSSFFMDIIVNSIFGLNVDSFDSTDNRYLKVVNSFFKPSLWDNMKMLVFFLTPGLAKFLKLRFVPTSVRNELVQIANEIIEKRKITDFQKNNAFDAILTKEQTPTKYSVAGLVFNFLTDGAETSAGVSAFVLYSLAANPHVQKKLRDELTTATKERGGKIPYEEIHRLPYLGMVYSETLRLYPPGLIMVRTCTKTYQLPPQHLGAEPVVLEKGTSTAIPVYSLHMDPEHFPDPEKFDPERFSEENRGAIKKFSYLPFGEGPRLCVGSRFAENQIKIAIAGIVRKFEVRLAPQTQDKPIVIDPNVLILRNVGGLWLNFRKIEN